MEYIVTALITGGLSLIGVIISNMSANKKIESGVWNYDIDMTLVARWDAMSYNITYNINGGGFYCDNTSP